MENLWIVLNALKISVQSLYKKKLGLKMNDNGNVVQHINEIVKISEKMPEIGIKFQVELLK